MLSIQILNKQKPRILGFCFTALFVFAGLLQTACGTSGTDNEADTYPAVVKLLSEDTFEVASTEGATARLMFASDYAWTISIPEDANWLTPEAVSGEAGKRITVKINAAANTGVERSAECQIISGATKIPFTVTQQQVAIVLTKDQVADYAKIYKPAEFNYDLLRSDSHWSFCRSKQSDHFIVFWDKLYGEHGLYGTTPSSPSTLAPSHSMYVDIDDLLTKAEMFYNENVNILKFADVPGGKSNLCDHKIGIFVHYTTTWMAYGGGYDNKIGALWINPATCKPVGSTIAHEIGHSFQYQVYADQVRNGAPDDLSTGFRYEIGQGTGFWEQCAQWQSYQSYAEQAFSTVNFTEFTNNCHRHFLHEHQRYASYFLQWHWAEKHGVGVVGEVWRESMKPEDPIQTYQRKFNLSIEQLNQELYDYAAKCATWDFDIQATNLNEGAVTGTTKSVREFGANYIGKIGWKGTLDAASGYYTVSADKCPEATGFNHIRLNVPEAGTFVTVNFAGLPNAPGFNPVADASKAGWHGGFVAMLKDGTRIYPGVTRFTTTGTATYTIPANCDKLWYVVVATPAAYLSHPWDENNANDEVWPYKLKFTNTDLYGNISFDGSEKPHNVSITRDVNVSAAAGYAGPSVSLDGDDLIKIAYAFVLQPAEILAKLPAERTQTGDIQFRAIDAQGNAYMGAYTANGYGYWFGADGIPTAWGTAYTFTEFAPATWTFQFGCHPTRVTEGAMKVGDKYTIKQALIYGNYKATIQFNITIVE